MKTYNCITEINVSLKYITSTFIAILKSTILQNLFVIFTMYLYIIQQENVKIGPFSLFQFKTVIDTIIVILHNRKNYKSHMTRATRYYSYTIFKARLLI